MLEESSMMTKLEDLVMVTKKEYESLKKDSHFLSCLEACGVDNWVGWDDAHEMMEEDNA